MKKISTLLAALWLSLTGPVGAQAPGLEPVGTIGCTECSGPMLFSGIEDLALTGDGRLIVADRSEPRIRIFAGNGRHIAAFGRTGRGPGEFGGITGIGFDGTNVIVADMSNLRLTRYDMEGRVLGAIRLEGFATDASFAPGGRIAVVAFTRPLRPELDLRTIRGDSLVPLRFVRRAEFPERSPDHFELMSTAASADGTFAVGDGTNAYRIVRFGRDGTVVDTIRRAVPRERYSAEELRALGERRDRNFGRVAAAMAGGTSAAPATPGELPAERKYFDFGSLRFDEKGRLWVRVERGERGITTFDVFEPNGRFSGSVRIAARLRAFTINGGLLAGVMLDDLDVQRVAVWRVLDSSR